MLSVAGCGGSTESPGSSATPVVPGTQARVISVTVIPSNVSLNEGLTQPLQAYVKEEGGLPQLVTWRTSNARVATVDALGMVQALCSGTAFISAVAVADTTKRADATFVVGSILLPVVTIAQVNSGGLPARLDHLQGQVDVVLNLVTTGGVCGDNTPAASYGLSLDHGTDRMVVAESAVIPQAGPMTLSFDTSHLLPGAYVLSGFRRGTSGTLITSANSVPVTVGN
ncbi:MAG: hypothetical protein JWO05_3354 [Gemmatimonadetes bacterium]|nr:hypothetical protein [Gemmatimonadota bacterium]